MVADHVDLILFERSVPALHAFGRLAFPLFAWLLASNAVHRSRDPWRYLARLLLFAAISQPVYFWTIDSSWRLNIFATLAAGLLALLLPFGWLLLGLAWAACAHFGWDPMSFGLTGAALVCAFGLHERHRSWWSVGLVIAGLWLLNSQPLNRALTLLVPALIYASRWLPRLEWTRRARWAWYAVYPAHLLMLWGLWLLLPR